MKVKEDKIKDLQQVGFKKGLYYYNHFLQIDGFGKCSLRVDIQTGMMDLSCWRRGGGAYSMIVPDVLIKMFKEGWIEE